MIRVVIDTNVLISGLLAPNGNEAMVLLAVRQELVVPCFSDEILSEYMGVLERRKFSFLPEHIADLMAKREASLYSRCDLKRSRLIQEIPSSSIVRSPAWRTSW